MVDLLLKLEHQLTIHDIYIYNNNNHHHNKKNNNNIMYIYIIYTIFHDFPIKQTCI